MSGKKSDGFDIWDSVFDAPRQYGKVRGGTPYEPRSMTAPKRRGGLEYMQPPSAPDGTRRGGLEYMAAPRAKLTKLPYVTPTIADPVFGGSGYRRGRKI